MTNIKHLFFDLDHTLWDFEKNSELTFNQIFKEQQLSVDFNRFLETYSPINLKYWRLYRDDEISKEELRYKRLKETFDTLNYEISDQLIDIIAVDYISYLPSYNHLLEGAEDILAYLQSKNYQLHIITNGFEEVQNEKLTKSGIADYFSVIVSSECVGVKKPNPKVFEHALSKASAVPQNSIMIGDSYEADVMGALRVGMMAIHLTNENPVNKGIVTIKSLLELKQYL